MNKYQEAYKRLTNRTYKYADKESVYVDLDVLKPLVEKTTPKKVIKHILKQDYSLGNITFKRGTNLLSRCPCCDELAHPLWNKNYCGNCGQRLDWSKEDE